MSSEAKHLRYWFLDSLAPSACLGLSVCVFLYVMKKDGCYIKSAIGASRDDGHILRRISEKGRHATLDL